MTLQENKKGPYGTAETQVLFRQPEKVSYFQERTWMHPVVTPDKSQCKSAGWEGKKKIGVEKDALF